MPIATPDRDDAQFYTTVDDEQYDELCELVGQTVVRVAVWEDSLAAALDQNGPHAEGQTADQAATSAGLADIDLYLRDNIYFELYATLCFLDPDDDPLPDLQTVERTLYQVQADGAGLHEVAVDEEDGLVLVLGVADQPVLYLTAGAWILDQWDELPESLSGDIV
jgi:hypothetical protein